MNVPRSAVLGMAVVAPTVIAGVWVRASFSRWRADLAAALDHEGEIAQTEKGPVEYAMLGTGPTVVLLHGGGSGHDFIRLYTWLVEAGFNVICPSRPGYLRTPLAVGETSEEQADMVVALLDSLGIAEAAVVGVSSGGQIALQLALRHPTRTWALLMLDAVSINLPQDVEERSSVMGRIVLSPYGRDVFMWLMSLATKRWPAAMIKFWLGEATTHSDEQISSIVAFAKQHPEQLARISTFQETISPMSIRHEGLQSDWDRQLDRIFLPLGTITAPTLVIHSRYDKWVPLENAEYVANNVPEAELVFADSGGHLVCIGLGADATVVKNQATTFLHDKLPRHSRP